MKKYISIALAAIMVLLCLSGCGNNDTNSSPKPSSNEAELTEKLQIVTTIFPEYDWVKQVLGDNVANAEITMLLDNGVDLHSYQPTAEDILKISSCDLFIYIGGESDKWVADALQEVTNKEMKVINLLDTLGDAVKEEQVVEGMEANHDHENSEDAEHEEGPEYDEHVWLSLKNAQVFCNSIADALAEIDPHNKDTYKTNANAYNEKLALLDKEYQSAVDVATHKTLLFGDRFPFRYLIDDYGLSYYAAFVGCSAETEASFETIAFLSRKVDELNLNYVLTIDKSDQKIAKAIIQNTQDKERKILTLDSLQSTTSKDVSDGATYLSIMESNLGILKEALK